MAQVAQGRQALESKAPASIPRLPSLDSSSGDVSLALIDLPAGATVASADARVSGRAFHGMLADLSGARVTPASVVYTTKGATSAPSGGAAAFIVDFGRSVSVLDLALGGGPTITLVLTWLGTDFAPRPAYPAGADTATPHASGAAFVGLAGQETQKLLVQVSGAGTLTAASFPGRCTISTGTVPLNVRASVNGRLPFWTKPGPLSDSVAIAGLAQELTALAADGDVPASLTLTTDTPGVLELDVDPPAVDLAAPARWGGGDTIDVAVAALTPVVVGVPLTGGGGAWHVSKLEAAVTGAFPPWRAVPAQASGAPGAVGLKVDANFSAARALTQAAKVYGVALPLRVSAAAEVHVALVADDGGVPSSRKPLAAVVLTLAAAADVAWYEALFAGPVAFAGGWLVVQAKTGAVEWAAAAEASQAATRTLGAAGGARWDRYPPVPGGVAVAQARMLRAPFPAENAPPLTLGLGPASAAVDPARDPIAVVLETPLVTTDHVLELHVLAQASGTLTLGPATASYRA